ncbi:hypothetical protein MCOR02_006973 [Pyricularia oryzae]|uniref:cutinase n=1 Tax=Pyricularia oryzae TaxID=318829 RepID=A0A4V1C7Y2_PYROR|nr:hypothetical protein MCOR02_006973 [Pyricularia oryzae]KAI6282146.1 hypothetical protein MCOR34_011098 [Pyricularia oryzae]KAI6470690.1 hypothetical protein MCOR17_003402 [Pyricularia oryzae]KAI6484944.1 hypothetical protein MCOR13_009823 [Pyricularia oryzae]KAI6585958.1 hypothetical protein MCOR04_004574 [Pyricularia oryzae]
MQLLRVVAKLSAFATSVLAAPIRIPGIPEAKLYGDDVSNQLTDGTPCRDLSVIYARGTTQSGNIGNSISVGPITFDALAKIVGQNRLAVQGVDYKASFMGYAKGGQPKATGEMVDLIQETQARCPSSRIVIVGYSQGAQVVHNVVNALPPLAATKLAGILTFGDPDAKEPVPMQTWGKWKIICHPDDRLCQGSHLHVTIDHLNYQKDAQTAAKWIANKAGLFPPPSGLEADGMGAAGMGAPNTGAPSMGELGMAAPGGIAAPAA